MVGNRNVGGGQRKNNAAIPLIIGLSTIFTGGLLLPIWLVVGILYLIFNRPQPKAATQPEYKVVLPSNEHADDWEFKIYDLAD